MEWIGPLLIGILVLGALAQLFWAYAISTVALKTDQSEIMQVLAWIPLLQIAPILAAGGGSIGRFLIGTVVLTAGNATLIAMAVFLGDGFGRAIALFGLTLTGLFCLYYFVRIACTTAIARGLPGWMGLLLFVPILNFFVYPYFAFHDGWIGPNKIGLAIGSVLILGTMAPSFQAVNEMNESGVFSSELLLAMSDPANFPLEFKIDAADLEPIGSSKNTPEQRKREGQVIRVLYRLQSNFASLESLTTPEKLSVHDDRLRALGIIEMIRADLEASRETLDTSTYGELATHLLELETSVHTPSSAAPANRRRATTTRETQFAPAAFDPAGRPRTRSYDDTTTPPVRPYPVLASDECPAGTETRTRKDEPSEEEWCQQRAADGGLRHGWYARYDEEGRPESMGQYENGLRVGVWTRFYPTGEVRAQAQFRDGMQHGWLLTFDRAGQRTRSARFENGAQVLAK